MAYNNVFDSPKSFQVVFVPTRCVGNNQEFRKLQKMLRHLAFLSSSFIPEAIHCFVILRYSTVSQQLCEVLSQNHYLFQGCVSFVSDFCPTASGPANDLSNIRLVCNLQYY